ncbi:MAG: hypothetical protein QF524_05175 [Planctomycetota bacterium]|nr:hypothetical protein [Planctomycetota bacterium]
MTSSAGLPQTQFAPDFKLVVWHFGLGVFGFVATAAACLFAAQTAPGHWFQAPLLGVVHIAALFWFFPIAMGALHQMVPVLFEVPIHSEKLSWVALLLLVLGASGLVAHMFTLKMGTGMAGTGVLTAVSVWVYAWNLLRTIQKSTKRDLVGRHVRVSLFFLILAITIGAALAFNFWKPILPTSHLWWLPAHAHLAIFGFFGLLIMGVGYKLAEMFLLAYGHSESDGRRAFWLMSLGLLILSVSFILNWNPNPGTLPPLHAHLGIFG